MRSSPRAVSRWIHARTTRRGHAPHQRRNAIIMVVTGLMRVAVWAALIALFMAGVDPVKHLYASVSFVSVLSVLALLLTDWGQVAASLAQLTAADAHHAVSADLHQVDADYRELIDEISRLADLHPGPEAAELASTIQQRLQRGRRTNTAA